MRVPPVLRLITTVVAVPLVIAGCSSSGGSGNSAPTISQAPSVPPTTAAGTGTTSATDASGRVAQWFAGVAGLFAAIQMDTEQIKADATKQDVQSLTAHCTNLRTDAAKVQGATAPPDKRIAAAVATAMTAYIAAAQSCLQGDYPTTAAQINKGGAALESANAIMNNLS